MSVGWRIGDLVPADPFHADWMRCPICYRANMKVIEVPPGPEPTLPQGWTKIPTE